MRQQCHVHSTLEAIMIYVFSLAGVSDLSYILSSLQGVAGCPRACECPPERPVCPPGVSLVPDGCGCCKVCAAQLNQDCHEGRPCDHHKGLECNYGNDVGSTRGICRGESCRCLAMRTSLSAKCYPPHLYTHSSFGVTVLFAIDVLVHERGKKQT